MNFKSIVDLDQPLYVTDPIAAVEKLCLGAVIDKFFLLHIEELRMFIERNSIFERRSLKDDEIIALYLLIQYRDQAKKRLGL